MGCVKTSLVLGQNSLLNTRSKHIVLQHAFNTNLIPMLAPFRKLMLTAIVAMPLATMAQSTLYLETFGTTRVLPSGWVGTTPGWIPDSSSNANNNSPIPQYSGSFHLNIRNDEQDGITPPQGTYSIVSRTVDATDWTDLEVSWAARRTSNFQATQVLSLEFSTTGAAGPWTALNFTDRPADGTWGDVGPVSLPSNAFNASQLAFRWTVTTRQATGTYRMDDFKIAGTQTVGLSRNLNTLPVVWLQAGRTLNIKPSSLKAADATLTVMNAAGQPVKQQLANGEVWNLNLEALPAGVYLIQAQQAGQVANRRVVLQ